ncbi:Retrovirus-related Pol polyprotein from transposon 17.6 [Trichinella sp. T6]|nr:Retrovirus-related Pol polyprotein from transposon 17.6 [Trichinella sp. T6]
MHPARISDPAAADETFVESMAGRVSGDSHLTKEMYENQTAAGKRDIVFLVEESVLRNCWKLGMIIEPLTESDGVTRTVKCLVPVVYNKLFISQMVRINRAADGATNGERGRIDGPEYVRPPEVLTMVLKGETWFEHMELYFRAGRIAPERRAALVQVPTGPERFSAEFFRRKQQRGKCVRVFAGHLLRLSSKAFPEMSGSADKILETDNFTEAVEVAVKEERVVRELTDDKIDANQEDEPTAGTVTEAAAAAVTTDNAGNAVGWATSAGNAKLPPVTRGRAKFMRHSKTISFRRSGRSETTDPAGNIQRDRIGNYERVRHGDCTWEISDRSAYRPGNIPFLKSHAVALVRAESPQSELMAHQPAHEAMEKMITSEQESRGKHQSVLAVILREFADVLSTSDEDHRRTGVVRHAIHTGDAKPVRCSPRRIPYHQRAQVETLLDEMLRRDVVEPSSSPWASPIVLVRKKDGSCRFCVNYRQLNNFTRKDAHPLQRIDDSLDALAGAQWFSTLDLASGYWQVEVEEQNPEKTAFTTPFGLYQFKVMPFKLCIAPGTLQRLIETVLRGLVGSDYLVCLDDVIVFGKTAVEHTARLRKVFRRLREVGLIVKPEKCRLMKRRVAYLGHIISEKGIATDPSKTFAVREWPAPTCVSEKRQFLGLSSYCRKFVNGFANVAAPLHRLLEKGAEWDWSKACQSAFDALKYHLTSAPVLAYPDFHRQFIVDVDASRDGLRAVLSQREGKAERVVAGKPKESHANQVSASSLAELDFEVEHRAGRLHGNADALSRTSCAQCGRLVEGSACAVQAAQLRTEDVAQSFKDQLLAAQQADPEIQLLRQ